MGEGSKHECRPVDMGGLIGPLWFAGWLFTWGLLHLGLPKALRLVESSGGTLAVDSKRGEGTRVTMTFPTAESG